MALSKNSMSKWLSKVAIATLVFGSTITPALAVQLANGKVFFESVPILGDAYTTFNSTNFRGATYYFEVAVPANAGEPMKKLQIQQREGIDLVDFNLRRTRASLNKRRGPSVAIESVDVAEDGSLTVSFVDAIAPGNTVHLGLRAIENPDTGGVYLFGVTAFPEGEDVNPQFIGFGRLHFFEGSGGGFSRGFGHHGGLFGRW